MADLRIRAATEKDRAELEKLISVCYGEVYPGWYDADVLVDALPAMLRVDENLLASGRYFAAEKDGRLAGCGGWSVAASAGTAPEQGLGQIRHFATHPDFMRQGVGGAVLDACIAAANKAGVEKLQCFSSLAAEDFYTRHGFTRLDEVTIMLDGRIPFPAVLMERELGHPAD